MRIYLKLTETKQLIPFNYQPYLTGAIHKWIGEQNEVHDTMSLYSFSWLQNVTVENDRGISLSNDSYFFVSAYNEALMKQILKGVMDDPTVCYGSQVSDVQMVDKPIFSQKQTFFLASPVFIKRRFENNEKHITHENPTSALYLTETLKKKLRAANLPADGVQVEFDKSYNNPKTKIIRYKDVCNRVSVCPVTIEGTPEQIAFAWSVGVGNSTGIGFGALK